MAAKVNGNHHFDMSNLTSRFTVDYNKGKSIIGMLELVDESDDKMNLKSNLDISYPGQTFSIHHSFVETGTSHSKYLSTLTTALQKGKVNTVETSIERAADRVIVSSDISLSDKQPFSLLGQVGYTDTSFHSRVEYNEASQTRNPKQYAAYIETGYDNDAHITVGAEKPDFGIDLKLKAQMELGFSVESDLQVRNDSKRSDSYNAKVWFEPTEDSYNGSFTVASPSRTVVVNANHQSGSKQKTHVDVSWDSGKFVAMDTSFQVQGENLIGTAALKSSLLDKDVKVNLKHDSNMEEYATNLDVNWGETLTINSVIKRPISLHTLVVVMDASSSVKSIRKMHLFINHKMKKAIVSNAKFSWNQQFYEIDVTAKNQTKRGKFGFTGQVDLKTSHSYMKKGTVTISHDNDGSVFNTAIRALRNKRKYRIDSKITHQQKTYRFVNNGDISIFTPTTSVTTKWSHQHASARFESMIETQWNKESTMARVSGDFNQGIDTACEVKIPFGRRGVAEFEQKFIFKEPLLDGLINLKVNENSLAKFEIGFSTATNFTSGVVVEIPDLDVNSQVQLNAYEAKTNAGVSFMATLTPETSMNLDLTQVFLKDEHISLSTITWTSTIPGHESFKYTYELLDSNKNELKTIATIEYSDNKVIQLQTVMLVDLHKRYEARALLTTPYEALPKMQGGINFEGDRGKFTSTANIEIEPYLDQITADVKWNIVQDLYLRTELLLPGEKQLTGEVNLAEGFHSGDANIAFKNKRNQLYSVSTQYNTDEKIEGTVTVGVPGKRDTIVKVTHIGQLHSFTTQVELQHNRRNNLLSSVKFSLADGILITASSSLKTTVVPEIDNTDFSLNIDGNLVRFAANGHFSTLSLGRYAVDMSLDTNNGVEASLVTTTPNRFNIRSTFSHVMQENYLQTKGDMTLDGKSTFYGLARATRDSKSVFGEIKLNTFLTEDFTISSRSDSKSADFESVNDISYGEYKSQMVLKSTTFSSSIRKSLTLSATSLPNLYVQVDHTGSFKNFNTLLEVTNGTETHRVESSFSIKDITNNLASSVTVQSPLIKPVSLSFNVDGILKNFKSHAEIKLGADKSEANLDFTLSPSVVTRFDIKSPYIPELSGSFSHEGSFPNMDTRITLVSPEMNDLDINMMISNAQKKQFSIEMATPFETLSNFETSLTFEQMSESVTASANCKMTTHGKLDSSLDMSVQLTGYNLNTQLTLVCPTIPTIMAKLTHEGSPDNFKCHAEYNLDTDQTVADFSFNNNDNLQSELRISSPFFEPIVVNLKHSGSEVTRFSTAIDTLVQGTSSSISADVDIINTVAVKVVMDLPDHHLLASLNETRSGYEGEWKLVRNEVTYALKLEYELTDKLNFNGKLVTPIIAFSSDFDGTFTSFEVSAILNFDGEVYRNTLRLDAADLSNIEIKYLLIMANGQIVDVDVSQSYNKRQYKFNGSFKTDGETLYGLDVSLLNKKNPTANIELTAPVKYNPTKLSAIWSPRQTGFTFTGYLDLGTDRSKAELSFDNSQIVESTIMIDSPFYPPVTGKFELAENYNLVSDLMIDGKKQGLLTVTFGDDKWQMTTFPSKMTVSMVSGEDKQLLLKYDLEQNLVDFSFSSLTPHTLRVVYFLQATLPEFKCNGEFTHQTDSWIFEVSADTKDSIEGSFKIEIPERDTISGMLSHNSRYYRCSSHAEFSWNDTTKFNGDLTLSWRKGIDSTLRISTPFKGYEVSEVKVSHEGSVPFIKSSANIKFAGNTISGSAELSKNDGEVTLKTPFEYLEDIAMKYNIKGDLSAFSTGVTVRYDVGKEVELDYSHSFVGMTTTSKATFVSPFTNSISVSAEHVGNLKDFTNTWEIAMGENNKITSKSVFKVGLNALTVSSTMTTIAAGEVFEQEVELKHDGGLQQFKTELLLKNQDEKIDLDISFQLQPVLEGKVSLLTPFNNMEDMSVSFTHSGSSSNVLTTAEVQYASGKIVSGKFDFINNGWRHFTTNVVLKTPFKNFEANSISYTHTGSTDRMQCESDIAVMGKTIKGTMAASLKPLSLTLNIDTPFEDFESIRLKGNLVADTEGHYSALIQTGWNSRSKIIMDSSLTLSPLDGSISISTPFRQLRRGAMEIFHKNNIVKYTSGIKIDHNSEAIFDMKADYDFKGDHKNLVITFLAPEPMVYSIDGDFTKACVDFDLNLNWNQNIPDYNMKIEGGYDMRFNDKTVKASMSNPDLLWSLDGLLNAKRNKVDIAWGRTEQNKAGYDVSYDNTNTKAKLVLPWRSLELTLTQQMRLTKGEFLWDADVDVTKKVGFQSVVVADNNALNADITITMPKVSIASYSKCVGYFIATTSYIIILIITVTCLCIQCIFIIV